jgi:hypothetical protein
MKKLIDAVNHPGFGVCVHIGGWTASSPETRRADNDAADRACLPYMSHTHYNWDVCENEEWLTNSVKMLYDGGYKGYYSAEHNSGQNEYNLTQIQLTKIRALLINLKEGGTGVFIPPRQPR